MKAINIKLHSISESTIELRCFFGHEKSYEKRILQRSQIHKLIYSVERDYYVPLPELIQIGQQLYFWLDGVDRWLNRAIRQCNSECLILQITTEQALSHLPWEVLHDGNQFLVQRNSPTVIPVRWVDKASASHSSRNISDQLKILFMATDPEGVEPKLDFEREESQILEATKGLPLELRVEESGCISELTKVWSRYIDRFDVFHLTGHASITQDSPYSPYFITETEIGERHETSVADLAKIFQFRWCPLIFLSGCRTGQAADQGAIKSMAEGLLEEGALAVLGWGRPVADAASTTAAAHLYSKLASGYSLPQALALTYQNLLKLGVNHWHLLRLYVRGKCPEALVEPLGDLIWIPQNTPYEEFLDPLTQQVRVATSQEFVGRRREIQYILRQFRNSKNIGVLIHGMGGVGKSTIAARTLDRAGGYTPIILHKGLDKSKLLRTLAEQCMSEVGHHILNSNLPFLQCLTKFLQQGLNQSAQRFLFVLDDFECNLEKRQEAYVLLDDENNVVETLRDLLKALVISRLSHKIVITTRYDFLLSEFDYRVTRLPLTALYGTALNKKYNRLEAFKEGTHVDPKLQKQAKRLADGNPRLLEYLNILLLDCSIPKEDILRRMEGKQQEFLENALIEALLEQLDKDTQQVLAQGLLFNLPVPREVFVEVCIPSNCNYHIDEMLNRAISLGVLELSREDTLRVPQLLSGALEPTEYSYAAAALALYKSWKPSMSMDLTEEQLREIYRLAMQGGKQDIATVVAEILSKRLSKSGRYREVVELCKSTLADTQDEYKLQLQLAHSEAALGKKLDASAHYQKAISYLENRILTPNISDPQEYITATVEAYVGLADIYHTRASSSEAIQCLEQALEKANAIQDRKSVADIYLLMGIVNRTEGRFSFSVDHISLALRIYREIDFKPGEAEAHHNLADSLFRLGKLEEPVSLIRESIAKHQQVGKLKEQAWSLSLLGNIYVSQRKFELAQEVLEQAIDKFQSAQHLHGNFITTYRLGCLFLHNKSFDEVSVCLNRLKELDTSSENSMGLLATGYINLLEGDFLYSKSLFDESIVTYTGIMTNLDRFKHSWMFCNLAIKLSSSYFAIREYAISLEYTEEAICIAQNKQYNDVLGLAYSLSAQILFAIRNRVDQEIESRLQNALKFSVLFNYRQAEEIFEKLRDIIRSDRDVVNQLIAYWNQYQIDNASLDQIEKGRLRLEIGNQEPSFLISSKLESLIPEG